MFLKNFYEKMLNELVRVVSSAMFANKLMRCRLADNLSSRSTIIILGDIQNSLLLMKMLILFTFSIKINKGGNIRVFYYSEKRYFSYWILKSIFKQCEFINLIYLDKPASLKMSVQNISKMTISELLSYSPDGVRIGPAIVNRLLRDTKSTPNYEHTLSNLDFDRKIIEQTIHCMFSVNRIISDNKKSDIIGLFFERGYAPNGAIWDLLLESDCIVYQWGLSPIDRQFIFKLFDSLNQKTDHLLKISEADIFRFQELYNFKDEEITKDVQSFINCLYRDRQAYNGQVINKNIVFRNLGEIVKELELDERPVCAVFPHIFYDATLTYGSSLYVSYRHWFEAICEAISKNQKVQWVIKLHPAHQIKDDFEGKLYEYEEIKVLREILGPDFSEKAKVIYPNSTIAAVNLINISDYVLTVRGTVGIEAACFGKEVLVAGTGRYDGLGICKEFDSAEGFSNYLKNLSTKPPMSKNRVAKACRAYKLMMELKTKRTKHVNYIRNRGFFKRVSLGGFDIELTGDSTEIKSDIKLFAER